MMSETWKIYNHFMLPAVGSYSKQEQVLFSAVTLSTDGL